MGVCFDAIYVEIIHVHDYKNYLEELICRLGGRSSSSLQSYTEKNLVLARYCFLEKLKKTLVHTHI
jgi:hypothetical protein